MGLRMPVADSATRENNTHLWCLRVGPSSVKELGVLSTPGISAAFLPPLHPLTKEARGHLMWVCTPLGREVPTWRWLRLTIQMGCVQRAPVQPDTPLPSTVGVLLQPPYPGFPPSDAWQSVSNPGSLMTSGLCTTASLCFSSCNSVCLPSLNTNNPPRSSSSTIFTFSFLEPLGLDSIPQWQLSLSVHPEANCPSPTSSQPIQQL